MSRIAVVGMVAALLPLGDAVAQDCQPEVIGSVGGQPGRVEVIGSTAYVANGNGGFLMLDVSDPTRPRELRLLDMPAASGVGVSGSYAYVVGQVDFSVIDVHNPLEAAAVASLRPGGTAHDVQVAGDIAYVTTLRILPGSGRLHAIDISDPLNPEPLGSVAVPEITRKSAVSGSFAYLTAAALYIVDVSDPEAPAVRSSLPLDGDERDVVVVDQLAYVTAGARGLYTVDVSDPDAPEVLGSADTPDRAWGLDVAGTLACVADGEGLVTIDVSDPTAPAVLANLAIPGSADAVHIAGSLAYVGAGEAGLHVVDISDPTNPSLIGDYAAPATARDIALAGQTAFVADDSNGLQIIDVSDPHRPAMAGSLAIPNRSAAVAVANDVAYVGTDWTIELVDVSEPANPAPISTYDGTSSTLALTGDLLYSAHGGLSIIDVADPTTPTLIGSLNGPPLHAAYSLAVRGNYVLLSDQSNGLVVVDASDPGAPFVAASADVPFPIIECVAADDELALVGGIGGGGGRVAVFGIADPLEPSLLGVYEASSYPIRKLSLFDDLALVSTETGLEVVDLTDPAEPELAGSALRVAQQGGVMANGLLHAASARRGMQIVDIASCLSCPADLSGDGVADIGDFLLFLDLFGAGDDRADFTGDGAIDAADFFAFLDAFGAGCD